MSENRVIGAEGRIPWHLPEDFKWFKRTTLGQVLVMGRKTFESIGRPLPGRETIILSRKGIVVSEVRTVADLAALEAALDGDSREVFVAGGGEVYAQLLPHCSDLYLTRVKRIVSGDAFFPPFEDEFVLVGTIQANDDFSVEHYQRRPRLIA